MDIQRKCFEESNNVNPDWSFKFDEELQQYIALDGEMGLQVDEFNEHWDTFRAGWEAKAQAVPEGFVLVPKQPNEKTLIKMSWSVALGEDQHGNPVYLSIDEAKQAYEAVIEAQEQAK